MKSSDLSMRFKELEFHSHQRTGSHYISAVVCRNFLGTDDYLKYYKNHEISQRLAHRIVEKKETGFIYTYRNDEDVLRSIWNFRGRFGLDASCEEEFYTRPARSMWYPRECTSVYTGLVDKRATTGVSLYFRSIDVSIPEHYLIHKGFWKQLAHLDNVLMVCYDDMINNFDMEMGRIAHWLGSNRTEFENIDKRIGWRAQCES